MKDIFSKWTPKRNQERSNSKTLEKFVNNIGAYGGRQQVGLKKKEDDTLKRLLAFWKAANEERFDPEWVELPIFDGCLDNKFPLGYKPKGLKMLKVYMVAHSTPRSYTQYVSHIDFKFLVVANSIEEVKQLCIDSMKHELKSNFIEIPSYLSSIKEYEELSTTEENAKILWQDEVTTYND